MQVTNISVFSLKTLLRDNVQGIKSVGYTVRPGFSNGLLLTSKETFGQYVGFKG